MTPLGEPTEVQGSPDLLAGFKGAALRQEGNEREGEGRTRGGKRGEGRGNSALVVGGIDAPAVASHEIAYFYSSNHMLVQTHSVKTK